MRSSLLSRVTFYSSFVSPQALRKRAEGIGGRRSEREKERQRGKFLCNALSNRKIVRYRDGGGEIFVVPQRIERRGYWSVREHWDALEYRSYRESLVDFVTRVTKGSGKWAMHTAVPFQFYETASTRNSIIPVNLENGPPTNASILPRWNPMKSRWIFSNRASLFSELPLSAKRAEICNNLRFLCMQRSHRSGIERKSGFAINYWNVRWSFLLKVSCVGEHAVNYE